MQDVKSPMATAEGVFGGKVLRDAQHSAHRLGDSNQPTRDNIVFKLGPSRRRLLRRREPPECGQPKSIAQLKFIERRNPNRALNTIEIATRSLAKDVVPINGKKEARVAR